LWEKILDAFGDGENTHEFVPPRPTTPGTVKLLDLNIVSVSGNTHSTMAGDAAALFSKGICPLCHKFLGRRSAKPLELESVAPGYDAGFVWQKPFRFVSADFRELLTPRERAQFDWREVVVQKPSRKTFYELVPVSFVPFVPVKGLNFALVICDACKNFRSVHSFNKGSSIYHYLCVSDIPKPLPSCFAAGWPHAFDLCFTKERWLNLVGRPGTKGMVSNPIGVVDKATRDGKPLVKLLSIANREFEAKQRADRREERKKMTGSVK
jgi:hypothetical protein